MKQGSFKFICLIFLACIMVLSVHGQDRPLIYGTWVLESFNGNGDSIYAWKTESSRFITKTDEITFPQTKYVDAYPSQNFRKGNVEGAPRSFGINGRFDRRGYNWIDIYPVLADDSDEKPVGIPVPGKVKSLDMWVWGSNLRYYIEVYFKDYQGVIHVLKLGNINFRGWRNMSVNIPTNIPQFTWVDSEPVVRAKEAGVDLSDKPQVNDEPAYPSLHFIKFRLWTQPVERVDNFHVYFKQLRILTDIFEALFDGSDLADPQNIKQIWSAE